MFDRDNGRVADAVHFQALAAANAKQARFHLFRALDLASEASA